MNNHKKISSFFKKYKHAWLFLYFFIYMPWFLYLERHVSSNYYVIHSAVDDKIPFIEYFIIPYLLWFIFIAAGLLYFFFTDVPGFYRLTTLLFTGMTIFLIISTFFPNGLALRPTTFAHDNFCVDLVKTLYLTDTPTNVFPSLHVFNSLGICIAVSQSKALRNRKFVKCMTYFIAGTIILATMFLKQHSIIDVIFAFVMAYGLYLIVYSPIKQTSLFKQFSW